MRLYNVQLKDMENKLLDNFNVIVGDYEIPTIEVMFIQGLDVIEKYDDIEFVLTYNDPILGYVTSKHYIYRKE